ncbi:MAG TPA: inositol monophosphatase family protein [Micromonosporaceae bacterium]|nr:inositol monophosphatase family protein [Micromonosporaceae bacterium]
MGSVAGHPDAQQLLAVAVDVVRAAAVTAWAMREQGVGDVATKSTDTDVVTAADRAVEEQAIEALRAARPGDTILGEESGVLPAGTGTVRGAGPPGRGPGGGEAGADGPVAVAEVRWLLDPIDGTVNYLYGLAPYAVSLAAEVAGVVVAGVVREVSSGEEWTAVRGAGAWRAGRRLAGSTVTALGQSLLATGFAYDPARRGHQARVVAALLPEVRDIRRFGAASVDLCLAAEGRVDAYYEKGLNPWDYAAGALVAAEAGLLVTGLDGGPPGPDFVLAAPAGIYHDLRKRLGELDAGGGP